MVGHRFLSFCFAAAAALAPEGAAAQRDDAAAQRPPLIEAEALAGAARARSLALPAIDRDSLLAAERLRERPGVPHRFATPRQVKVSPWVDGTWETEPDGSVVWRLRLESPGATSLNLGFQRFRLPRSGRLRLYSPDGTVAVRPFTAADNEAHGELWTPALPGDTLVVELRVAPAELAEVELELAQVGQGFRPTGSQASEYEKSDPGSSGDCNVDVRCSVADPWRPQVRAVGRMQFGGEFYCSGSLVNNTRNDRTPYFVTADHCGVHTGNDQSVVVVWNFENSTCRGVPGSEAYPAGGAGPGDGTLSDFNSGAIFRAEHALSDMTLIELDDPVSAAHGVFFAGWDRRNMNFASAVAIHHPRADEKRITFADDPTQITSYEGAQPSDDTHLRADWDLGTTEPGSSGSPLYSPEGRFVGQLHGGPAACGVQPEFMHDYYGRLFVSWTGGGTNATRLSNWLDPDGTGVTTLDGIEGAGDAVFADDFESGTLSAWTLP